MSNIFGNLNFWILEQIWGKCLKVQNNCEGPPTSILNVLLISELFAHRVINIII